MDGARRRGGSMTARILRRGLAGLLASFLLAVPAVSPAQAAPDAAKLAARAEAGDAGAQIELARMLFKGRGVPKDDAAALGLLSMAAERHHPDAMFYMVSMGLAGAGGPRMAPERAAEWLQEAADAGSVRAMTALGRWHADGIAVAPDCRAARLLWERAAALGDAEAMYRLGRMSAFGSCGTQQDWTLAESWWRRGASAGGGAAMHCLGRMREEGRNGPQNLDAAAGMYGRACGVGFEPGCRSLARLQAQGWTPQKARPVRKAKPAPHCRIVQP